MTFGDLSTKTNRELNLEEITTLMRSEETLNHAERALDQQGRNLYVNAFNVRETGFLFI